MFAPYTNDRRENDQGLVLGVFSPRDAMGLPCFEYAERAGIHDWEEASHDDFPHVIWAIDKTTRVCRVLKTVAYVVVDEDEFGKPIVEKWQIKRHRKYS